MRKTERQRGVGTGKRGEKAREKKRENDNTQDKKKNSTAVSSKPYLFLLNGAIPMFANRNESKKRRLLWNTCVWKVPRMSSKLIWHSLTLSLSFSLSQIISARLTSTASFWLCFHTHSFHMVNYLLIFTDVETIE